MLDYGIVPSPLVFGWRLPVVDQSALVSPFRIVCMLKVGSASGRQVSPVIPEVSRRCDVTPEVETVTYCVYRVLSQQVCVLDKR